MFERPEVFLTCVAAVAMLLVNTLLFFINVRMARESESKFNEATAWYNATSKMLDEWKKEERGF